MYRKWILNIYFIEEELGFGREGTAMTLTSVMAINTDRFIYKSPFPLIQSLSAREVEMRIDPLQDILSLEERSWNGAEFTKCLSLMLLNSVFES